MGEEVLYQDGHTVIDAGGVTLRRYYFPTGRHKRIAYHEIRDVRVRPMNWWTGKGRGWGTAHPGYWLPLDLGRWRKDRLVVLDLGGRVKPAFTPDDPDRVVAILRQRTRGC